MMRSPFPGYARLLGPEQLALGGLIVVRTAADYRKWHTLSVISRHGRPWDSPEPAGRVYIDAGRILASCRWCFTGMYTRPDWGVAYCGECGARYGVGQVRFPANFAAIERILCRRPQRDTQQWGMHPLCPDRYEQTPDELERENEEVLKLC